MDTLLTILPWGIGVWAIWAVIWLSSGHADRLRNGPPFSRKPPGLIWRLLGASNRPR